MMLGSIKKKEPMNHETRDYFKRKLIIHSSEARRQIKGEGNLFLSLQGLAVLTDILAKTQQVSDK